MVPRRRPTPAAPRARPSHLLVCPRLSHRLLRHLDPQRAAATLHKHTHPSDTHGQPVSVDRRRTSNARR
jgi:hypothetical protein